MDWGSVANVLLEINKVVNNSEIIDGFIVIFRRLNVDEVI